MQPVIKNLVYFTEVLKERLILLVQYHIQSAMEITKKHDFTPSLYKL